MSTPKDEARVARAAERLAAAYRVKDQVRFTSAEAPSGPAEAMAVQGGVMWRLGATVGGSKVSIRPDGLAAYAPMFRHWLVADGDRVPLLAHDQVGIEPEIGLELRRDLPPRPGKPYTRDEVLGAIGRVFAGIEVVMPRVADFADIPFASYLADNIGNAGYVHGRGTTSFAGLDLSKLRFELKSDGAILREGIGGNPWVDPLVPLVACASAQIDAFGGFTAGQIVTTGSLCGVLWRKRGERISLEIEGIGSVALSLV